MKKNILLLVALLAICTKQYGQISNKQLEDLQANIPLEKIYLQTNANLLLAGEYLKYKAATLNLNSNVPSDISKMVYVSLIGANNTIVFNHKITVLNNNATGDFFIPASIKTGHYKLISYSNWSKNNTIKSYAVKNIYIINPFTTETQALTTPKDTIIISSSNSLARKKNLENNLITLAKDSYNKREHVEVTIANSAAIFGSFSVSVRKLDAIQIKTNYPNTSYLNAKKTVNYLPELRGEIISGIVTNSSTNQKAANKTVSLSFPAKNFLFKNAATNQNGTFYFVIDESYSQENAIFQIQENDRENYSIAINDKTFTEFDQLTFSSIELDESISEVLKNKSIQNQIENAYYQAKQDSIVAFSPRPVFYHPLAKRFVLDDYNRFPTIKETFTEIISNAYITKNKGQYMFHVRDLSEVSTHSNIQSIPPLILFDGILVQDLNDLVDYYDSNKIEYIDVVNGQYVLGSKVYDGIIAIKTFDSAFSLKSNNSNIKEITIDKPLPNKTYYHPQYTHSTQNANIPDYRTQLFWNPKVELIGKNKTLSFFTSDVEGTFEITLEGYSNTGNYIVSKAYLAVN